MTRRILLASLCASFVFLSLAASTSDAQQAFGRAWGYTYRSQDWERFYHYPYVYYPQNFWGDEYYRSSEHLYYRYPPEMRIPVYNRQWYNYYPQNRGFYNGRYVSMQSGLRYHRGHHFNLDVF